MEKLRLDKNYQRRRRERLSSLKKKLVWVPNLFTLGNLTLGFISVITSMKGEQDPSLIPLAGLLIVLAVFFDGLDGFAARLLDAQSELGAQLDSLADLTTFGIAPGVLMYVIYLDELTIDMFWKSGIPAGMFLAAIFPAFAAFRLARFNVDHSPEGFTGLPSPIAGIIIAMMAILSHEGLHIPFIPATGIYILIGILMVSTVGYAKPQVTIFRNHSPARIVMAVGVLIGVLIFMFVRYDLRVTLAVLFGLIMIYVLSGIVSLIIHLIQEYRV